MPTTDVTHRLEKDALGPLIRALRRRGYRVVGPTLRDGAIVYDAIEAAEDLPVGWTESQEGGHYRLERRGDDARFGYAVGPHSWKKLMFPAEERLRRGRELRRARRHLLLRLDGNRSGAPRGRRRLRSRPRRGLRRRRSIRHRPRGLRAREIRELERAGVPRARICVSLERKMKCAIGTCGHCQLGPHFVCKGARR